MNRCCRGGPDALRVTAEQLAAAIEHSRRPIKAVLLDQAVLAGVGNIYADEALFASGINPATCGERDSEGDRGAGRCSARCISERLHAGADRRSATIAMRRENGAAHRRILWAGGA